MKKHKLKLDWIFLFSLTIFLFSCGTAVKLLVGLPNLKVYSQEEINRNISLLPKEENVFDAQLDKDLESSEIKNFIYMSIPYRSYIYNSDDLLLCYNGETFCTIDQLNDIKDSTINENYQICSENNVDTDIDSYLGSFDDILSKTNISNDLKFDAYDHKVIVFMNTDIAKDEIIDDWNYIYNSLNNNSNFVFIRVWTDLNENWGLKENGKARFKVRRVKESKGEYEITLPKLPYK
ncbi:hypothetical protein [Psychroflexus aestuariivivens]|uniref:hypothetical protein n=1 Tax=Psychroflexus aestuariivivens TaxID=1795040 RepID=UPI000FD7E662|nr:hypothetical protein [Psychroflexus aestuariivivens]